MRTLRSLQSRLAGHQLVAAWGPVLAAYSALACLVALPGLGTTGLVMMEGMVADTVDTMLETGEFLDPQLYGELFSYKPPLAYWTAGLATWLAGRSEWSLRLPSALAGIGLGFVVMVLTGTLIRPRTGLWTGLASLTGLLFLQKLKLAEFDAQLAAAVGIAVALACFNLARQTRRFSTLVWLGCYLALAAAFLVKGMPALMAFVPGLVLASRFVGSLKRLLSWSHLIGVTLFAAIVAGYFILAWQSVGPSLLDQPLAEARDRGFAWTAESLGQTLVKPLLIWIVFLPWSLAWTWRSAWPNPGSVVGTKATGASPADRLLLSAWGFLCGGSLAFILVPTLEIRYFLPLATAGAIVSGVSLERQSRPSLPAHTSALLTSTLFAGTAIVVAFVPEFVASGRLAVGLAGVAALAFIHRLSSRASTNRPALLLLAAALCFWMVETYALRPRRAAYRDLQTIARSLSADLPVDATVWSLGAAGDIGKNASLYYYLARPVQTFRTASELPEPGSHVVLSAFDVNRLALADPTIGTRLRLLRRIDHSRRMFLLYRVAPSSASVSNVQRTGSPVASLSQSTRPPGPDTP